nr:CoA pyrophosphatase [Tissierella sp.]
MKELDIYNIKKIIENRKPKCLEKMSKFSVLVPFIKEEGKLNIIFELRAKDLRTQPGEVSFPGGRLEEGETFEEAAVRETMEELNIRRDNIDLIGEFDYLVSYSNMEIHSFIASISGVDVDKILPNPGEVDHLFTVPLEFFLNNEPNGYYLDLETRYNKDFPYNLIPNGKEYNFRSSKRTIYFYEYKDYIIWGYTASIIKHLIDELKQENKNEL